MPIPGAVFFLTRRRAPAVRLALGIAVACTSAARAADAPTPRFKHGTPVLRPFFRRGEAPNITVQAAPPAGPSQFNPDPGGGEGPQPAAQPPETLEYLFGNEPILPPDYESEPLRGDLSLPRRGVRGQKPIKKVFHYTEYPLGREGLGVLPNSRGVPNRWLLGFPHWTRYLDPTHETTYQYDTPKLWHPYQQSTLKGDVPIIGQDIFLNLTAKNFSLFEKRKLPTPSGVSAATPNSSEFFGRSEQVQFSNDTSIAFDLFQGETAFKPVHWLIRMNGVYNYNIVRVKENGLLDPDPRGPDYRETRGAPDIDRIEAISPENNGVNPQAGIPKPFSKTINPGDMFNYLAPQLRPAGDGDPLVKVDPLTNEAGKGERKKARERDKDFAGSRYTTRRKDFFALQEAFGELHIGDLSDNYDFISSRWGIQPFVSDFRGFIFADTNLGARIFGNYDNNRIQYNLAYFNQREKDTYSDLNTFDSRHQQVVIANVYRQDFIWKGYTSQLSFHANFDDGGVHFDKNDFQVRPQVLGSVRSHDVKSFYFGWAGDGHIGRYNISHAFYQVTGEDEFNGLAGRRVDINAQMAALELSYDRDWIRFKISGFYASGDSDPTDRVARGFDTILENPFFIGGPFSWYVHQGFNLGGTGVNLKQRDSLVPNLRSSKTEGQSNFVNPGVMILGVGSDIEVTPKLRAFANLNYIWLSETKPVEVALQTNKARNELGLDASLGFKFRPLLTDNIIFSAGVGFFFPGGGYKDIYRRNTEHVRGFGPQDEAGKVDDYLYNAFFTLTLLY
ncbi:MAG TPA: hypothetical protein VF614_01150 [Chthoniobacteraceae bacterium]